MLFGASGHTLAAEEAENAKDTDVTQQTEEAEDAEDAEEVRSLLDERREMLEFGIDSEIIQLLPTLEEQREDRLYDEIAEVYGFSLNTELRTKVLSFFRTMEHDALQDEVVGLLDNFREEPRDLILEALRYTESVMQDPPDRVFAALDEIARSNLPRLAPTAIRVTGAIGADPEVRLLLALLKDDLSNSEVRSAVVLALGELGHTDAVEPLMEILDDTSESETLRHYAADSLGKIGDSRALPAIRTALSEGAIMRAYSVHALSNFPSEDNVQRLLTAALRDSNEQVRTFALRGLANAGAEGAFNAVRYRAERDPEHRVRIEAYKTLASYGSEEAFDFLRERYEDKRLGFELRSVALSQLVEHDLPGTIESIQKVIAAEWEERNSRILDHTARSLSTLETAQLNELYVSFLDHPDITMQLYGIRAVGRNSITSQRERLETIAEEATNQALRRTARAALDSM
ncbi:MAG: HEAT repeat domain-containing protein [Spirochaeta sp.]|nr:HEAT repeat domain-containing protein [Spirochaeta sp.]